LVVWYSPEALKPRLVTVSFSPGLLVLVMAA
jgi:hypothetical protein